MKLVTTILDLFGQNGKAEARNPDFAIAQVRCFPLGGINKTAEFNEFGATRPMSRAASA